MADKAPVFNLGLVMAGAVSAGAYTGGVMDFLIEALEEWEKEKDRNRQLHGDEFSKWDVPFHQINIKAMAGASAGGMTAAMTAASIAQSINHVRSKQDIFPGLQNKFFNSWVNDIDIRDLTKTEDFKKDHRVKSILDSSKINSIAASALGNMSGNVTRPFFSKNLQLFLTVSNMRGIPYHIKLNSTDQSNLSIIQHGDYFHFEISRDGSRNSGTAIHISLINPDTSAIETLKNAGVATGAFPIGLAPVTLSRKASEYAKRNNLLSEKHIKPSWPEDDFDEESFNYVFESIDGGLINNEPLELARIALLPDELRNNPNIPDALKRNPRESKKVKASVIMIDPFPSDYIFEQEYDPDQFMQKLALQLVSTLRHQAMFKTSELVDAMNESIYSRFLIAPTRSSDPKHPIACGTLGGFGGFLCKDFRMHDYFLGRRNAQRFLTKYFSIPMVDAYENIIFKDQKDQYTKYFNGESKDRIPIIPLFGTARQVAEALDWPKGTLKLEEVMSCFESRVSAVTANLVNENVDSFIARNAIQLALKTFGNKKILNFIRNKITDELRDFDLI